MLLSILIIMENVSLLLPLLKSQKPGNDVEKLIFRSNYKMHRDISGIILLTVPL